MSIVKIDDFVFFMGRLDRDTFRGRPGAGRRMASICLGALLGKLGVRKQSKRSENPSMLRIVWGKTWRSPSEASFERVSLITGILASGA